MSKEIIKEYIKQTTGTCRHFFTVVNWRTLEQSKSATQLMCQVCLSVVNFQDVSESCGELKAEELHVT